MGCNCGKPKCDGKCGISPAVLQINNPSTQQFNFVKANGTVYYQQINTSTGEFETHTIA